MVMSSSGMEDVMLRERLPALWRRIEDAHYSYLEIDDSPEKLLQKKKLEGYILEYLTLVPHECKFGLAETGKVFQRTINELQDYSAYRAGIGWAAIARYAGNLLSQPWRKEYKVIRLYSGFFKHEVEPHLVGPESLLQALGYRAGGAERLALHGPVCPDMAAAVSRDALIAYCECQIMCEIWEAVWGGGGRVSWAAVARERASRASTPARAAARLSGCGESEIYSNVPATCEHARLEHNHMQYQVTPQCYCSDQIEEPVQPIINPYLMPKIAPPHVMYELPSVQCNPMPMMTPYGVPYYYPVQTPYMIPTPVYAPIKQATNIPVNGYPPMYLDMPAVPTAQLIELEGPSVYENGKFGRQDERSHRKTRHVDSKRTSKSGFSDVSLPSLPRSDTQPTLSKAKEDGMGTYESWDYVFRNLSSKDRDGDSRSGFSQSLDRDSRTLDRLDREERRSKFQPTTLDLEDGLQALNLDRSYDEDVYRTAKINENLMRLKQEQELKKTRQIKKQVDEKRPKRTIETVGNPKADGLITPKVAPDKIKLLTKKEVKDRKDVIKHQNSVNGSVSNMTDVKRAKKPAKLVSLDADKKCKPVENGVHKSQSSKSNTAPSGHSNHELKAQLIVSLDEPDHRRSPKQNGEGTPSRASDRQTDTKKDKWQCGTCTYLNRNSLVACEMCGKSRKGPEIEPLTSGGRECPACTLVNKREARACDACGTGLEHCPTYI